MTRPTPRRAGKARVWKAWAHLHDPPSDGYYAIFKTRHEATHQGQWTIKYQPGQLIPVEIREVLPRKAGARRAR